MREAEEELGGDPLFYEQIFAPIDITTERITLIESQITDFRNKRETRARSAEDESKKLERLQRAMEQIKSEGLFASIAVSAAERYRRILTAIRNSL